MSTTVYIYSHAVCFCVIYALVNDTYTLLWWYQVALADDVGKSVEELLGYLGITVKVDSSGSLLCVQQVSADKITLVMAIHLHFV